MRILMPIKPPETTAGKITLISAILLVAASFTTVGGAIVMWDKVRPWMSEAEERSILDRDANLERAAAKLKRELAAEATKLRRELEAEATKLRRELEAEDKLLKTRACENTLARLQGSLFQARDNEVSAVERAVTLADTQAKSLNRRIIQQAREAQHTFEQQYEHEKKECNF